MIILICQECKGSHIERYEGKMTDNGHDWFHCKNCDYNFSLRTSDYRSEHDIFES
jgi:transposase-like protein